LPFRADFRPKVLDRYRSRGIQGVECAGKTKYTMVIRRMFGLINRRERAPVSPMQAKLGKRKLVKRGSIRYLNANDCQQQRLHNKRTDNRRANQPSPE
jgi:hypothetical protein